MEKIIIEEKIGTQQYEIGVTQRTKQLKKDLVTKACYVGKYVDGIFVDVTRARLYMESYKATEADVPGQRH